MDFYKLLLVVLVTASTKYLTPGECSAIPADYSAPENNSQNAATIMLTGLNNMEDQWAFRFGNVQVIVSYRPTDENDNGTWTLEMIHRVSDISTLSPPERIDIPVYSNCTVPLPYPPSCSEEPPKITGPVYEFYNGLGYYYLYQYYTGNFDMAKSSCIEDGSHLAIINSQEEAEVIASYMKIVGKREAYVGIISPQYGIYETIYGDPLSCIEYEQWSDGKPSNGSCIVIDENGKYSDTSCNRDLPYVCEAEYPC